MFPADKKHDLVSDILKLGPTMVLARKNNKIPGATTRGVKKWYNVKRTVLIAKKQGANDAAKVIFLPVLLCKTAFSPVTASTMETKTTAKSTSVALNMSCTML